ncbi:hypothetical protein DAEQUDRAFT_668036 [Daedalea quercina L-15889]|uniref:Peroxisome membrane anchor protein Pex14p N-terminal domain-containing protein n=1 Tax=Daedalea quercina L-15889 TaxID=1314783 RepID=A0A165R6Q9_9APHY|nr:hypothetical protein DAEQUDRAFT_668036 [Daedalea quercina L-15889]
MVNQPANSPVVTSNTQPDERASVVKTDALPKETTPETVIRTDLLDKARVFLNSPQARHEDYAAKRRFLVEKGLKDDEIDGLLREMPPQAPLVPPRTYPQPPPSNLPALLLGVARVFSWIAGSSAVLLMIYFRFLYPRIAQTYQARHALRTHQKDLLDRLTALLEELKSTRAETAVVLPRPALASEAHYRECQTLDDVLKVSGENQDVPDVTLLRCAITELFDEKKPATSEAIFFVLEGKIPWLRGGGDEGGARHLWQTLTSTPLFHEEATEETSIWTYTSPLPPPIPPLMQSLYALRAALPAGTAHEPSRFQYTLNALTDLTGYIAMRTYDTFQLGPETGTTPGVEEEVKREIRGLKGLVLNRRAFMPNVPRPQTYTPAPPFNPASVNPS